MRLAGRVAAAAALALVWSVLPSRAEPPGPDLGGWETPCYNCYNYATNKKTAPFAQPGGDASGGGGKITCDSATAGATSDGLVQVVWQEGDPEPVCPEGSCLVALAVLPDGGDYHWYRKNQDGTWSQKHGSQPAIGTGDDGKPLDPQDPGSRGDYSVFCGYFCVPSDPMPKLTGGDPWTRDVAEIDIRVLSTSGVEAPRVTVAEERQIELLRAHLPSGIPAPDPGWSFADLKRGFSLVPTSPELGLPVYLVVHGGVVAYYSDLEEPEIVYVYDDKGLEAAVSRLYALRKLGGMPKRDRRSPGPLGGALTLFGVGLTGAALRGRRRALFLLLGALLALAVAAPAAAAGRNWNVKKGVEVKAGKQVTVTVKFTKDGKVTKEDTETFENDTKRPLVFQFMSTAPAGTNCKSEKKVTEALAAEAVVEVAQLDAVATVDLQDMCAWLEANGFVGSDFRVPFFAAPEPGGTLYGGVVWDEFLGAPVPDFGEVFEVGADGRSPALPGYVFSRVPLEMVPGVGFVTPEPYQGQVVVTIVDSQSDLGIDADPKPLPTRKRGRQP